MKHCRTLVFIVCILSVALRVPAADWPQFRGENFVGVSTEKDWQAEWKETPPMWTFNVQTGFSSVAVVDGLVYIAGGEKIRGDEAKRLAEKYPDLRPTMREFLFCLDAETGEEKWRAPLDLNRYNGRGSLATPAVSNGRVYAYSHYGIFLCCDTKTGEEIWRV
ncbi:MAG: PQQ-binding-like beta-propeller repeat protein, partial [Candidatus Sumerlaeota bacterium]